MTDDHQLVEALSHGDLSGSIGKSNLTMLEYAGQLTLKPATIQQADVQALRNAGFSDAAILDINQVTSYFAFANRLVDGLGVELEDIYD